MKLRTIVKIAVISPVVLLCTGFAMFSFFRLSAAEGRKDFNLYTLVPGSATVVLETDDLAGMIQGINELSCSKDRTFSLCFQIIFLSEAPSVYVVGRYAARVEQADE